jgi:hypothetical protein
MMSADITRPFESSERAHEFVVLLGESIEEAAAEVREHLRQANALCTPRTRNGRRGR